VWVSVCECVKRRRKKDLSKWPKKCFSFDKRKEKMLICWRNIIANIDLEVKGPSQTMETTNEKGQGGESKRKIVQKGEENKELENE
jgi:hypothetical protein